MLLIVEHREKTFKPGGERRITTAGSDTGKIKKLCNLSNAQEEARKRMLAKTDGTEPPSERRKSKWPKRPFGGKPTR